MKKRTNKELLELGRKIQDKFNNDISLYMRNLNLPKKQQKEIEYPKSCGSVQYSRSKEYGTFYHIYCVFESIILHDNYQKILDKEEFFFEDCDSLGKSYNEKHAREKGWIIGLGINKNVVICKSCKEKLQTMRKNEFNKIFGNYVFDKE